MKICIFSQMKIQVIMSLIILLQVLSSCNDFLGNDDKFYHVATQEQQWNSLTDNRSALMGIYGLMRSALAENNTYWACGDLRLGDFSVYEREDLKAIASNKLLASFDNIQRISNWNRFYKVVNAAAVFMENAGKVLEKDKAYSETNYQYDVAQARALRALAYFYMVRMWGDVPLITQSYDNGSFPEMPRTDAAKVLNYVKGELQEAASKLPILLGDQSDKYYGSDANTWKGVLIGRLSVNTILAHVAAWEGNYIDVHSYTNYILSAAAGVKAGYLDIADLVSPKGIFKYDFDSNKRAARLLSFVYRYKGSNDKDVGSSEPTTDGHLEAWTLAEPLVRKSHPDIYISKEKLFEIFTETTDVRFGFKDTLSSAGYYTNYISNISTETPVFSKIKVIRNGEDKTNDYGVFGSTIILSRMEDIALLDAEALCMLNRGEEAIVYLNEVRAKRNLKPYSFKLDFPGVTENDPPSVENLLKEIFNERRRELMGEGHYWFDRIRRAKLIGDDPEIVHLLQSDGGIYWPVAKEVIKANSKVKQTDYWNN